MNFVELCIDVAFGKLDVDTSEISKKIVNDLKKINKLLYISVRILNSVFAVLSFIPLLIKKSTFFIPGIRSLVQLIRVLAMMRIMNRIFQK